MIATFYSYKGGVGRSMALANVARWLQLQGLRVVIVDWDLEAPGLESFFAPSQEEREALRGRLGLIDLLAAYKEIFPNLPAEPQDAANAQATDDESSAHVAARRRARALRVADALSEVLPPLRHVLFPVKPSSASPPTDSNSATESAGVTTPGALWLLSAGSRNGAKFNKYAETVQDFDWEHFYTAYEGEAYFEWFRRQLLAPDLADIVLIDSRTGVAEMSGACTRQLADVIVMMCAPNDQNLDGVERMAESFVRPEIVEARGNRAIDLIMVPARVDTTEGTPVDVFNSNFREKLERFAPALFRNLNVGFSKLRIPYVSKYAYGDRLAVGEPDGVSVMQVAYATLATHIAALAPADSPIRRATRQAVQQTFGLPTIGILPVGPDAQEFAADLQGRFERAGTLTLIADGLDVLLDPLLQRSGPAGGPVPVVVAVATAAAVDRQVRDVCRRTSEQGIRAVIACRSGAAIGGEDPPRWLRRAGLFDVNDQFSDLLKTVLSRSRVARTPFTAPPMPEAFVGRTAELAALKLALMEPAPERSGVALVGAGGTGKSAIAAAVCHDEAIMDFFDDGIVWATLGAGARLLEVYTAVAACFSREAVSFHTVDDARRAVVDLLASRQCLLVLDDVWDASQLLPQSSRWTSRVLVTTKAREVAAECGRVIPVGPLTRAEGAELLGARLPLPDTSAVLSLVDSLDGIPLALRQANRAIRTRIELGDRPEAALRNFAADFRSEGLAALDVSDTDDQRGSMLGVFRSSAERLMPADRARLHRLAQLSSGVWLSLEQAARAVGLTPSEAEAMFRRLAAASLVDLDAEGHIRLPHLSARFFQTLEEREKRMEVEYGPPPASPAAASTTRHPRIFISYNGPAAERAAARLADRLTRHFGYDQVFLDRVSITPGSDWFEEVEGAIRAASAVVALIGPAQGRSALPDRFVHELRTAFKREIPVIPVTVEGAEMPARGDVPSGLDRLPRLQAVSLGARRFHDDVDQLIKVLDHLPRTTMSRRDPAAVPRRGTVSMPVVAAALMALVVVAVTAFYTWKSARPPVGTAATAVTDPRIARAFELRQNGELDGAIDVLTEVLRGSTPQAVAARAARDRAYVYKLQRNWPFSIADLGTALALSTTQDERVMLLRDRANAYLEIPDVDAALEDYKTLTQLSPDDQDGIAALQALNRFLTPTEGVLFVFPRFGAVRRTTELPPAVQKLDQISFLNVRYWWHDIPATEVRYTSPGDEPMARAVVQALKRNAIDVKGPALLSETVPRSRRVELWLSNNESQAVAGTR
jgi:tetratricopeptide (TPR) repeat protein